MFFFSTVLTYIYIYILLFFPSSTIFINIGKEKKTASPDPYKSLVIRPIYNE